METLKLDESEAIRFGQSLAASIPPQIRDCFGPTVEQAGWISFFDLRQSTQKPEQLKLKKTENSK